jgi:hypothetical protein
LSAGWDNDCLGLTAKLAEEAEWRRREEHNEAAVASWAVEAPDGWGNTPPTSPVVKEGWPGSQPEDHCYPSKEGPLGPNGWPDVSIPTSSGVRVTTTMTTVEEVEGHSARRLPMLIVCLSVPDLLSFLYHSTISTSFGSCAPRRPGG